MVSGQTLNNTNVVSSKFQTTKKDMVNSCWVYGGESLTSYRNTFTATGGSLYTLDYKPHSTEILIGGSTTPKVGGVYNILTVGTSTPGSPTQYLVDYDNKKVIFISGTSAGNNVPVSGTDSIAVNYYRGTTVAKYATSTESILAYGEKDKIITDTSITDPTTAMDYARNTVERYKDPIKQGTLQLQGLVSLTAGNTVVVTLVNE